MTLDAEQLDGGDADAVVVLLHGRGADRSDMRGLARELPRTWTYVLPDAPFPAAPWGYGPGHAWYRFMGGDRPEEASFSTSLEAVDELIRELPDRLGVVPRKVVLGGFSQGGTLSLGYALARPGRVAGVLNLSGFLPAHPEVPIAETARGLPVFWGHGTQDPNIPFVLAAEGRDRLRGAGAAVAAFDYAIGHWIDPVELADASAFLEALREA